MGSCANGGGYYHYSYAGACMNRCLIHDEFYRWVVVLMGVVIIIIRMQ